MMLSTLQVHSVDINDLLLISLLLNVQRQIFHAYSRPEQYVRMCFEFNGSKNCLINDKSLFCI